MRHSTALLLFAAALSLSACGTSPAPQGPAQEAAAPALDLSEGRAPLPLIPIDPGVFGLRTQTTYLVCRNERSGPYERLQTDPLRTGDVNFVAGTAHLPPGQAASTAAFPYLYFGGQPREGRAADAGMYADASGVWIPVVNVEGVQRNLPRETDAAGNVFVYRVAGAQPVGLRMRVPADGTLSLGITARWLKYQLAAGKLTLVADVGESTRTIDHPGAAGWTRDGVDQVFKVMTTVAFPGKGNFALLSGDYVFSGSRWSDLRLGLLDPSGEVAAQRPLTADLLYGEACLAPADVVSATPAGTLPEFAASIRLRRPAQVQLVPDRLALRTALGRTVRRPLTVGNTGREGSLVRYSFTPPGEAAPARGTVAVGERARVPVAVTCGATAGTEERPFPLVHAVGETFDGTVPSATPEAQPGDLLYRTLGVPLSLECAPPRQVALVLDAAGTNAAAALGVADAVNAALTAAPDDEVTTWGVTAYADVPRGSASAYDHGAVRALLAGVRTDDASACPQDSVGALLGALRAADPRGGTLRLLLVTGASPLPRGLGALPDLVRELVARGARVDVIATGPGCLPARPALGDPPLDLRPYAALAQATGGRFTYAPGRTREEYARLAATVLDLAR